MGAPGTAVNCFEGKVSEQRKSGAGYAGDVTPKEAFDALMRNETARLIDVRTDAEWNFVGLPDLSAAKRRPVLCQWQLFPSGSNPAFVSEAEAALKEAGYQMGAPLYFLCRSGGRSRAAAIAMTGAGHGPCFNIIDGFEGGLDGMRRRGTASGWKADGLPWTQT